jgi:hypothetical protein
MSSFLFYIFYFFFYKIGEQEGGTHSAGGGTSWRGEMKGKGQEDKYGANNVYTFMQIQKCCLWELFQKSGER